MLIIRPAQMEVFRRRAVDRFVERMVQYVAREFPDRYAAFGDAGCEDYVRTALKSAATFRIEHEGAVAVYLELMLEFGDNFERAPHREWAGNILANVDLPGPKRIDMIRERFSAATRGRRIVAFPTVR
jgi:hypothetical protein